MTGKGGYTLVEMLVAIVLAGLAMLGLGQGARSVAQAETRVRSGHVQALALRRIETDAGQALAAATGGVFGDDRQVRFDCDGGECGFDLIREGGGETFVSVTPKGRASTALGATPAAFGYVARSDGAVRAVWPREGDELPAALVLRAGETPVAVFDLPRDQALACAFDRRTGRCSTAGQR